MRRRPLALLALTVAASLALLAPSGAAAHGEHDKHDSSKRGIEHIVVIYQENHSFDNLYGGWEGVERPGAGRDRRTPRRSPRTASPTTACCRTTST